MSAGYVCIDTWAGRREVACVLVGETARKYRVRFPVTVVLPRGRIVGAGEEVLVPKRAVKFAATGGAA